MESHSEFSEKSVESSKFSRMLPPVILSHKAHTLISSVKEVQLITTYEEVLDGLGQYIAKKNLYDPQNKKICCKDDDLGIVLGTEDFSITDLNAILPKLAVPVSKTPSSSAGNAAVFSENPLKRKLDGGFDYDQRKIPAMQTSPLVVHIPPSPTYCDLSDSVESIQSYETAFVKDTNDEFLSAENGEERILAIEETFDVEYEVETDTSDSTLSEDSSDSDEIVHIEEAIFSFLTQVVYKPKPDSDIEFFADASSDDDEQSDAEISEFDFWSCPKCSIRNKPTVRYCLKCFQQRRNWLPDKPSNMRRKHRKSPVNYKKVKDVLSEASSSKCHPGVSCEIRESSSNSSAPTTESAGSCKTDPGDSLFIQSKDFQDTQNIVSLESLDLMNGESSCSFCMDDVDLSNMKSAISSSMKSPSSSMKSTISSNWDSSGPSSMESVPSSMESGVYSLESSGPSSNEFSCPSSMDCSESSRMEKYDSEKLCMICCSEPVNASIIHGKFGHQISCYKCARKLQKRKKDCPVCRRAIDRVVIQITM